MVTHMKYSKRQAVTYLTASQCSGGRFYSRVLYFFVGCIEPKRRTRIVDRAARTAAQRERSRNIYVRRWDGIMGGRRKKGGGGGGCSTLNVVPDFAFHHTTYCTHTHTHIHTQLHTHPHPRSPCLRPRSNGMLLHLGLSLSP